MLPIKAGTLALTFTASVLMLVLLVTFAELSDREVLMLGLVQTMLSVTIGWLLTHGYAVEAQKKAISEVEEQHQKNLRTYALKAAEKVENLSKEMARLERYLQVELESSEYDGPSAALAAKQERIESAIHVLTTLRSVNDTSLSDWRGVIPEELDQRRVESIEHEQRLESLLGRLEQLEPDLSELGGEGALPYEEFERLEIEVTGLKSQLRHLAREVGTPFVAKRKTFREQQKIVGRCPGCLHVQPFSTKGAKGGLKAGACKSCKANLILSNIRDGEAEIRERVLLKESIDCPSCENTQQFLLDEWLGSAIEVSCSICEANFKASRAASGVRVFGARGQVPQAVIDQVRALLPQQPWEKGVHRAVADQLNLPPKTIQQAIRALIETGVFLEQIDGVLYTRSQIQSLGRNELKKLYFGAD
jgi:hypothetical protein